MLLIMPRRKNKGAIFKVRNSSHALSNLVSATVVCSIDKKLRKSMDTLCSYGAGKQTKIIIIIILIIGNETSHNHIYFGYEYGRKRYIYKTRNPIKSSKTAEIAPIFFFHSSLKNAFFKPSLAQLHLTTTWVANSFFLRRQAGSLLQIIGHE